MKNKIGYSFLFISLFCTLLYGLDKWTSDNPSDSSLIRIGLSDIDSSNCQVCELNEIYYESGCKRCIQDGIVLTAHVSNERLYNLGWSNNDGMYYGDNKCGGSKNFKNTSTNRHRLQKQNESLLQKMNQRGPNLMNQMNKLQVENKSLLEKLKNQPQVDNKSLQAENNVLRREIHDIKV